MREETIPAEPGSRILALHKKMCALYGDVSTTLTAVKEKQELYYGADSGEPIPSEKTSGIVNDVDWMIDDIGRMIYVIKQYIDIL